MRISDWSSDVCSSDLGFDGEELGLTWDGYRADMYVAGDASRSIFDFVRRDKAGGKPWFMVVGLINPHDIMFYDATGEQAKHRMVHPDILGPLRREPGDPIYEVDNKFDLLRSEEHTSELQSLMRTSYAVFCLKKKNKKDMT